MNKLIARGTLYYKYGAYTRSVDVYYDDSRLPKQQAYPYNVRATYCGGDGPDRVDELARIHNLSLALDFAKRHIGYHLRSTCWLPKTSPLEQLAAAMDDTQVIDLCDPDAEIPEWVYKLHTSPRDN